MQKISKVTTIKISVSLICIILALASVLFVAPIAEDTNYYEATNNQLDKERSLILGVSASLMGLSMLIAAVPDDITTPVANQITQLNDYLVLAIVAIMLEKILLPVFGMLTFRWLIPIGFALIILSVFEEYIRYRGIGIRIIIFSILLTLLIPSSARLAAIIDENYGFSGMIERIQEDIENTSINSDEAEAEDTSNWLDKILNPGETIKKLANSFVDKINAILSNLMDAVAALIITTCVIPIGVLILLLMIAKGVFSIIITRFSIPEPPKVKELLPSNAIGRLKTNSSSKGLEKPNNVHKISKKEETL